MTPPLRRAVVQEVMDVHGFSERHACDVTGFARSSQRYQASRRSYAELSMRLAALAGDRPRFGYRRLHIMLGREGFKANHKLVYRLYRLAGLKLRGKRGKRRCGERRGKPLPPIAMGPMPMEELAAGNPKLEMAGFEGHVVLEVSTRRATSRHEREVLLGEALRNTRRALAVGASRD